jgi:type IV secretion system protein VirB4
MSLWLRGYRKRGKRLASLLHWDSLDTPAIVKLRDGGYLSCLALDCPNMARALPIERVAQAQVLNSAWKHLYARWGLQIDVRRRVDAEYAASDWPDMWTARLDAERRAQWAAGGHFRTAVTLSLTYTPLRQLLPGWQRLVYEDGPSAEAAGMLDLDTYQDEIQRMISRLKAASIAAIPHAEEDLLTYLHSTVSMHTQRVAVPDPACYLNSYLTDMDFAPGLYPRLGHPEDPAAVYLGCLRLHGWTRATHPGMLAALEDVARPYRLCLRYIPWDRRMAIRQASRRATQWDSKQRGDTRVTDRSAGDRAEDAQEVWRGLEHGAFSYGLPTVTVVVWDPTLAGLRQGLQEVEQTCRQHGLIARRELLNATDAWIGTLPGEMYANVTGTPMHSLNLAHLFPASQPWPGQPWNAHLGGPAVLRVTGPGRSSVDLSLHEGDVGHCGIIGSTGDGKSTLANALCVFERRHRGQQHVIFDKHYAALRLTGILGGQWYDQARTPLQPLAALETAEDRAWAVEWLAALLTEEHVVVTPMLKTALYEHLCTMATWAGPRRTMQALSTLLPEPAAAQGIGLYGQGGPYAGMTGGDQDLIADHPWLCFEMHELLETPRLLNIVLPALFHQLERRLTGAPMRYVLHEGWIALETPYWRDHLRGWFKGFRTRNGAVTLLSQSLADAVNSPIMSALLDNIPTWVFTPNPAALGEEEQRLYRKVHLNESQCQQIALGTKKQDYFLHQTSGWTQFQLDLGPQALAACATPYADEVPQILADIATYGADYGRYYFTQKGLLCNDE